MPPGYLLLRVARRGPAECHHTQQYLGTAAPTASEMIVSLALQLAAGAFHVEIVEIRGYSRALPIVTARHAAWWLLRRNGRTLAWIGGQFRRDHSTVMYGLQSLQQRMDTEIDLLSRLEILLTQFNDTLTRG
jgi:chromosomal replication initiation ATPase DnaA